MYAILIPEFGFVDCNGVWWSLTHHSRVLVEFLGNESQMCSASEYNDGEWAEMQEAKVSRDYSSTQVFKYLLVWKAQQDRGCRYRI